MYVPQVMLNPKLMVVAPAPLDRVPTPFFDWNLCCICQNGGGALTCPLNNPVVARRSMGYASLASNLEKLKNFNYRLPSGRNVHVLDDGEGILPTFLQKGAKWHKNCTLKFLHPKFDELLTQISCPVETTESEQDVAGHRETRSRIAQVKTKDAVCFLCNGPETWNKPLRRCETQELFTKVKRCAHNLNDTKILALLEVHGDLVAQEAKYHPICLTQLYNRCRRKNCTSESDINEVLCEGMAFAELVIFIQGKMAESSKYVFRMGELMRMYSSRVAQPLGVDRTDLPEEHTTRTREKILAHFPNLKAEKSGREYVLLTHGVNLLHNICQEDQDDDALAYHRFALNLRKSILISSVSFNGDFAEKCEEQSIPGPLLAAISTLMYGSSVMTDCGATKPAVTICQLIMVNLHASMPKGDLVRHNKRVEPPLPLYMGLSCYGRSRNRAWIDEMHRRGVSVSSNRVMEISSQLCRMVVQRAKDEEIVCPSNLKKGLFTVAALDNIDHKTTSTTSQGEFHGTGISVFQCPLEGEEGEARTFNTSYTDMCSGGDRSVPDLPDSYAVVPDYVLRNKEPPGTGCSAEIGGLLLSTGYTTQQWREEESWLNHIHEHFSNYRVDALLDVSWSAFHASRERQTSALPASSGLLPLFHEKSTSAAMIRHGMDIIRSITEYLSDSQVPVLCVDQPPFALAKTIQWNWPDKYGEEKFVILLGPLHIEQSFVRVIGQFMENCGWVSIVANSGVTTAGCAEAHMKVIHVKKAREMHQISAAVLHALLQEAYSLENPERETPLDNWIAERAKNSPTFFYWLTVLNLEILLLTFVRAVRQGLYSTFKECVKRMLPWYFLFDHHHYARWLTVHLKDLEELSVKVPDVHVQFSSGKFVVRKTTRPFSALGIDHAHEQNNAVVKGSGGAVGLTQDPSALRRWTIGGPEVSRLLEEFENHGDTDTRTHHEQTKYYQNRFLEKCAALKDSFVECENPFSVTGKELIALDSRVVSHEDVVGVLYAAEEKGFSMYNDFVMERLVKKSKPIQYPIKKCQEKNHPEQFSYYNSKVRFAAFFKNFHRLYCPESRSEPVLFP